MGLKELISGVEYTVSTKVTDGHFYYSIDEDIIEIERTLPRFTTTRGVQVSDILEVINPTDLYLLINNYLDVGDKVGSRSGDIISKMVNSFTWGATQEGYEYWNIIYTKLLRKGI